MLFLAGIPLKSDRRLACYVAHELPDLLELGVRQGIHRVDDDGARAPWPTAVCGEHMVHDGDEKAEGLPRPGACRHHEALAPGGQRDGLLLVLVERERDALLLKDFGTAGLQEALGGELADVSGALVARVDLDERLGPVAIFCVDGLDLPLDILGVDPREGRCEVLVLVDDAVSQGEDVEGLDAHCTLASLARSVCGWPSTQESRSTRRIRHWPHDSKAGIFWSPAISVTERISSLMGMRSTPTEGTIRQRKALNNLLRRASLGYGTSSMRSNPTARGRGFSCGEA